MSAQNRAALTPQKSFIRSFMENSASGGIVLMVAATCALAVANSPWRGSYFNVLHAYIGGLSVIHWINDALMAVFFLMVGLEIKREVLTGQLATWPQRVLPGLAAFGGMVGPALVYLAINADTPDTLRGWAIPAATDIAFALGILSLLGSRVPLSLKVFLTALAIIDDLGAVLIIALFYTAELNGAALAGAAAVVAVLIYLNKSGFHQLSVYLVPGLLLWYLVLLSGIHATLAGVVLAMTIPLAVDRRTGDSSLVRLEHSVHPWVAFLIVPVFGFANAGVSFEGVTLAALMAPVPLGVAAGLFIGKQVAVFGIAWITVKLGAACLPAESSWGQFYGVSLLCGVGFTMSLFIGLLAFPTSPMLQDEVKLGVIAGSLMSGLAATIVLVVCGRRKPAVLAS